MNELVNPLMASYDKEIPWTRPTTKAMPLSPHIWSIHFPTHTSRHLTERQATKKAPLPEAGVGHCNEAEVYKLGWSIR